MPSLRPWPRVVKHETFPGLRAAVPAVLLPVLILIIGLMPMTQMFEGLATAYIALVVPALVLAVFERFLKQTWAVGLCAAAGFAWLWALISAFGPGGLRVMLTAGGIGALSATLCCLIASMVRKREPA
jgi:hypothetical protein